jgi:hypothetical protein
MPLDVNRKASYAYAETIRLTVMRVPFHNRESGFTVAVGVRDGSGPRCARNDTEIYDSNSSKSSAVICRRMLFSSPMIASASERLLSCRSRIFSSIVSRATRR